MAVFVGGGEEVDEIECFGVRDEDVCGTDVVALGGPVDRIVRSNVELLCTDLR